MTIISELEQNIKELKSKERVNVQISKQTNDKVPPYLIVGNGRSNKEFPEHLAVDTFRVLSSLSPDLRWLFINLKDILVTQNINNSYPKRRVENPNLIILERNKDNELHKSIRKKMSENGYRRKLEEQGVLKQLKPGTYMLNPHMFIPSEDFKRIAQIWKDLPTKS
jgi:hypothetical protein